MRRILVSILSITMCSLDHVITLDKRCVIAMAAKETKKDAMDHRNLLENDDPLEDATESEFTGVTLSLSADNDISPTNSNADTRNIVTPADNNANVTANSNSCTTVSTSWQIPPFNQNFLPGRGYFAVRTMTGLLSFKEGALENAVENCQPVILENLDGQLQGAWLLTEIDHWDNEKERLVLITEKSLLLIKYDFIALRMLEYRRLYLKEFDCIIHGDVTYPEKSLMPKISGAFDQVKGFMTARLHRHSRSAHTDHIYSDPDGVNKLLRQRKGKSVRAMWNKGRPLQFSQNWNPWSKEIPFVTFTSHHLFDSEVIREKRNYDVEAFYTSLTQAVQTIQAKTNTVPVVIKEEPVLIENYVGLASVVHNAVDLGFFKSRGRVSF